MPGPLLAVGNSGYTALSTAGTSTLNPGASISGGAFGVLYGASCAQFGTGPSVTISEVIPPTNQGTNTTTTTTILMQGTFTAAGQVIPSNSAGLGVRYRGNLVAVYAGVASQVNVLWD